MYKKGIIIAILAVVAVIGVMAWGYGRSADREVQRTGAKSSLTAPEQFYDFGTISMADGKVHHVFSIDDPTDGPITLRGIETSCMCTTAYLIKNDDTRIGPFGMPGMGYDNTVSSVIPAHGSQTIDVVFDPAAHGPAGVGKIDRTIDVMQADGGVLQFEIAAVVTP